MRTESSEKSIERGVWAALITAVLLIAAAYLAQTISRRSKAGLDNGKLPVISQVSNFNLTNQLGQSIRLSDLLGKVWVADIIFTRCPGPCVQMTRAMSSVRKEFLNRDDIAWVSITADPEHDTPPVLKEYADKWVEPPKNWHFLTGPKPLVAKLSIDDLKLVVVEKDANQRMSEADLFLHSTKFVLLDRQGRLRGIYEGTEETGRKNLAIDLRLLMSEN